MMLSRFYAELKSAPDDAADYLMYLATTDADPRNDIDVELAAVGDIRLNYEDGEVIIIPASSTIEKPVLRDFECFGSLLSELPQDVDGEYDMRLLIELPLSRDSRGMIRTNITKVRGVHCGVKSQEMWLLAVPVTAFPHGALPA